MAYKTELPSFESTRARTLLLLLVGISASFMIIGVLEARLTYGNRFVLLPLWFWVGFVGILISLLLAIQISLEKESSLACAYGVIVGIFLNIFWRSFSNIRYESVGGGNDGWVMNYYIARLIQGNSGHVPSFRGQSDGYVDFPALGILEIIFSSVTGVPLDDSVALYFLGVHIVYVLFLFLISKLLIPSKYVPLAFVILLLAAFPNVIQTSRPIAESAAIAFLVMIWYILLVMQHKKSYGWILAGIIVCLAIISTHHLTLYFLLLSMIGYSLYLIFCFVFTNLKSDSNSWESISQNLGRRVFFCLFTALITLEELLTLSISEGTFREIIESENIRNTILQEVQGKLILIFLAIGILIVFALLLPFLRKIPENVILVSLMTISLLGFVFAYSQFPLSNIQATGLQFIVRFALVYVIVLFAIFGVFFHPRATFKFLFVLFFWGISFVLGFSTFWGPRLEPERHISFIILFLTLIAAVGLAELLERLENQRRAIQAIATLLLVLLMASSSLFLHSPYLLGLEARPNYEQGEYEQVYSAPELRFADWSSTYTPGGATFVSSNNLRGLILGLGERYATGNIRTAYLFSWGGVLFAYSKIRTGGDLSPEAQIPPDWLYMKLYDNPHVFVIYVLEGVGY